MPVGRILRHSVNALSGVTLFGLLLGFGFRGQPSLDPQRGLIIFSRTRLRWRWAGAVTFGDVVLLRADWTRRDPAVTAALAEIDADLDKRDFGNWLHEVLRRFHEAVRSPGDGNT